MNIEEMQPIDVLRTWQSNYVPSLEGDCYAFRGRVCNTDEYFFRPEDRPQLRTFLRFQFQLSQDTIDKLFPV